MSEDRFGSIPLRSLLRRHEHMHSSNDTSSHARRTLNFACLAVGSQFIASTLNITYRYVRYRVNCTTGHSHRVDCAPQVKAIMRLSSALCTSFDGCTRLGEALAIVVQFLSGWSIQQRVVRISMLAKSVNKEELLLLAREVLSTELEVMANCLLTSIHDRAAVNTAVMRTISILYPSVMNIGCFSHTVDNIGDRFAVPTLDKFMKQWETMFKHSYKAKLLWREQTGFAIRSYSPTRWWSRWECAKQVMQQWEDVLLYLRSNPSVAPKSREKIERLQLQSAQVQIELAVNVDAGETFVKATYALEGDGPLALQCYDI